MSPAHFLVRLYVGFLPPTVPLVVASYVWGVLDLCLGQICVSFVYYIIINVLSSMEIVCRMYDVLGAPRANTNEPMSCMQSEGHEQRTGAADMIQMIEVVR